MMQSVNDSFMLMFLEKIKCLVSDLTYRH